VDTTCFRPVPYVKYCSDTPSSAMRSKHWPGGANDPEPVHTVRLVSPRKYPDVPESTAVMLANDGEQLFVVEMVGVPVARVDVPVPLRVAVGVTDVVEAGVLVRDTVAVPLRVAEAVIVRDRDDVGVDVEVCVCAKDGVRDCVSECVAPVDAEAVADHVDVIDEDGEAEGDKLPEGVDVPLDETDGEPDGDGESLARPGHTYVQLR